MFLEGVARPLLVLHAVAAAVLVAVTTHHLVWCRGYLRGAYGRQKGERRFAWLATSAYVATLLVGLCLYPTYKVRVRAEYFDNPTAIAAELAARKQARADVGLKATDAGRAERLGAGLAPVARAFDVKEHAVALGAAASLLLLLLSRRAHPSVLPRVTPLYLGLAVFCCGTAWLAAIVGLVTASYRSVGAVL